MNRARPIIVAPRHVGALLALLIVSVAGAGTAQAACDPTTTLAAPIAAGTVVTCTNTTSNQNDPTGCGNGTESGITINVLSGASVTGTNNGLASSRGIRVTFSHGHPINNP